MARRNHLLQRAEERSMNRYVLPFPILPGKDPRVLADELQRRPSEYTESRRKQGVTMERSYVQTTPMGQFLVSYLETTGTFAEASAVLAQSTLDIDKFFRDQVLELHGIDLTAPAPPGPPPETVGAWFDPEVRERRRGLAFSAPVNPGSEDADRAFIQDAFSRPEMTASRRALGNNAEVVTAVATPQGTVVGVYLEGNDPAEANRRFAASTQPFDVWFKGELKKVHPAFIDFNQPVPGIEEIFDSETILARA
jgi:hypothetical protein